MPLATPRPAAIPMAEASTPSVSASATTDDEHLAAAGAEGAQHRELATPLGDGDAEGVEDDEGADEDGDAGERQEHRREERADRVGRLGGRIGGGLLAGLDADAGRHGGLDVCGELLRLHTRVGGRSEMPLMRPGSPPQRCTSCRRPATTMVPPMDPDSPHSKTPATFDLFETGRAGDGEGVAGLQAGLVGEALDDRDLVAALDLAAGDEGGLVEGLTGAGRQQRRGAAGLDGFAVDDRGARRLVDAGGLVDAGDGEHLGHQVVAQRLGRVALHAGERRSSARPARPCP